MENSTTLIRKPALKRLCRRAGIKRLDGNTYAEIRTNLRDFLKPLVRQSIHVMRHSGHRITVTSEDVVLVLKNNNAPIYGV